MDNREMDAKIARWMGWRLSHSKYYPDDWPSFNRPAWFDGKKFVAWADESDSGDSWSPSSDLNAMARAEAVVRERGLIIEYSTCLAYTATEYDTLFQAGIFATADQRARALCRVIEGLEQEEL